MLYVKMTMEQGEPSFWPRGYIECDSLNDLQNQLSANGYVTKGIGHDYVHAEKNNKQFYFLLLTKTML